MSDADRGADGEGQEAQPWSLAESRAALERSLVELNQAQLTLARNAVQGIFRQYAGPAATLLFEVQRGAWMAGIPFGPDGPSFTFELTGVGAERPDLALLAAIELLVTDAPPELGETGELPPDGIAVRYCRQRGRWQVHLPCSVCDGGWLDTPFEHPRHDALGRFVAKRFVAAPMAREERLPCPHCISRMMREADPPLGQATFWYDTTTGEWMLYEPLADVGASTPLGLFPYFVDRDIVAKVAARQLHS